MNKLVLIDNIHVVEPTDKSFIEIFRKLVNGRTNLYIDSSKDTQLVELKRNPRANNVWLQEILLKGEQIQDKDLYWENPKLTPTGIISEISKAVPDNQIGFLPYNSEINLPLTIYPKQVVTREPVPRIHILTTKGILFIESDYPEQLEELISSPLHIQRVVQQSFNTSDIFRKIPGKDQQAFNSDEFHKSESIELVTPKGKYSIRIKNLSEFEVCNYEDSEYKNRKVAEELINETIDAYLSQK